MGLAAAQLNAVSTGRTVEIQGRNLNPIFAATLAPSLPVKNLSTRSGAEPVLQGGCNHGPTRSLSTLH